MTRVAKFIHQAYLIFILGERAEIDYTAICTRPEIKEYVVIGLIIIIIIKFGQWK
jgi:hypothetical protein